MRLRLIGNLAGVIAAIWLPGLASAQTAPTFARLQPGNRVEILDLRNDTWRQVYRSDAWKTDALSVGPSGDRLALLAWSEGQVADHGYVVPPVPHLTVIDTSGRILSRPVAGVQRYAWCGTNCIVYITGLYVESDIGFVPDSLAMLNVTSGQIVALPKPPTPIGLTWGAFDSAAYVKNLAREGEAVIYRIDLRTFTLEATAYKDHLFSPTGRYYMHRQERSDTVIIYETSTNTPVDVSRLWATARLIGWGSPTEDVLLLARRPASPKREKRERLPFRAQRPGQAEPELTYQLYDLPSRRIGQTLSGRLDRSVGPDHQRLVQRGGDYQTLQAR